MCILTCRHKGCVASLYVILSIVLRKCPAYYMMKVTRFKVTKFLHGYSDMVHRLPLLAADLLCFLCGSIKTLMAWQAGLADSTGAGVLWG